MTTAEWRRAACNHPPGCVVIDVDRAYCMVCERDEQIIRERRAHRKQLVRLALENAALEDRVIILERIIEKQKVRRAWA